MLRLGLEHVFLAPLLCYSCRIATKPTWELRATNGTDSQQQQQQTDNDRLTEWMSIILQSLHYLCRTLHSCECPACPYNRDDDVLFAVYFAPACSRPYFFSSKQTSRGLSRAELFNRRRVWKWHMSNPASELPLDYFTGFNRYMIDLINGLFTSCPDIGSWSSLICNIPSAG